MKFLLLISISILIISCNNNVHHNLNNNYISDSQISNKNKLEEPNKGQNAGNFRKGKYQNNNSLSDFK